MSKIAGARLRTSWGARCVDGRAVLHVKACRKLGVGRNEQADDWKALERERIARHLEGAFSLFKEKLSRGYLSGWPSS